jgi:N-acetylmuramoyl-L-alanine amidase
MTFRVPASWAQRPSPNHSTRTAPVSAILLHADAATRIESSLDWVRRAESKVSYHVMVGRNGSTFHVVHPDRKAWHAGVSSMDGVANVNDFAVGVCLSNSNQGERFPITQLGAAADVCALLCGHYAIPVARITTHALVATPAGRKTDPKGLDLDAFREMVDARLAPAPRAA